MRVNESVLFSERVHIIDPPRSLEGSGRIILKCDYRGYPRGTITWYKDGEPLKIGRYYHSYGSTKTDKTRINTKEHLLMAH